MREISNRYWLLMSECGVYFPDDGPVWLFVQMSDHAFAKREDRLKAAREGMIHHG